MNVPSTLELLPNELLIDIFEYLPVQDLYTTFSGLNTRLTTIINSFQSFQFEQPEFKDIDDSVFADRVTTLVIRHSDSIDLSRYPKLRALKLVRPTQRQCDQAMQQNHLEHLHSAHSFYESDIDQLLKHIFTNGFSQLRSLNLENFSRLRPIVSGSLSILPSNRSMQIFTVNTEDIVCLLSLCPNLSRLLIKFFGQANIELNIIKQWLPTPHENLRTLTIDIVDEMSIEIIDSILKSVPNVTFLSIKNPRCEKNKINIEQIAHSLNQRLLNLKQFSVSIWNNDLALNDLYRNNIEAISSLHRLFRCVQRSYGLSRLLISSSLFLLQL